jgi:hypothetical protein
MCWSKNFGHGILCSPGVKYGSMALEPAVNIRQSVQNPAIGEAYILQANGHKELDACTWKVGEHFVMDTAGVRGCVGIAISRCRKFVDWKLICASRRAKFIRHCFHVIFMNLTNNSQTGIFLPYLQEPEGNDHNCLASCRRLPDIR